MLLPILVFLFSAFMVVVIKCYNTIIKHLREEIELNGQIYLRKTGNLAGYGSYDLLSLDNGKIWYDIIKDDEAGGITVNRVFDPELIKHVMKTMVVGKKTESQVANNKQEAQAFVTNLFKSRGITVIDDPPNRKRKK